jgi:hypothetical protein
MQSFYGTGVTLEDLREAPVVAGALPVQQQAINERKNIGRNAHVGAGRARGSSAATARSAAGFSLSQLEARTQMAAMSTPGYSG